MKTLKPPSGNVQISVTGDENLVKANSYYAWRIHPINGIELLGIGQYKKHHADWTALTAKSVSDEVVPLLFAYAQQLGTKLHGNHGLNINGESVFIDGGYTETMVFMKGNKILLSIARVHAITLLEICVELLSRSTCLTESVRDDDA